MTELIGWIIAIYFLVLTVRLVLSRVDQKEAFERFKEEADKRIRIVDLQDIPEHNAILAYDKENNQFLAQGSSVDDVKANIMARFPTKIFILGDNLFSAMPQANAQIKLQTSTSR